jgi:hypothetical protein
MNGKASGEIGEIGEIEDSSHVHDWLRQIFENTVKREDSAEKRTFWNR